MISPVPNEPTKSKIEYLAYVDLKVCMDTTAETLTILRLKCMHAPSQGSIPGFIAAQVAVDQPMLCANVRKMAQQIKDITPYLPASKPASKAPQPIKPSQPSQVSTQVCQCRCICMLFDTHSLTAGSFCYTTAACRACRCAKRHTDGTAID